MVSQTIEDNKQQLRTKYEQAKALGASVSAAKARITELRGFIQRHRMQRSAACARTHETRACMQLSSNVGVHRLQIGHPFACAGAAAARDPQLELATEDEPEAAARQEMEMVWQLAQAYVPGIKQIHRVHDLCKLYGMYAADTLWTPHVAVHIVPQ